MSIKIDLKWRGREAAHRAHEAAVEGITDALEHTLGVSQELVPLREGPLQDSGHVIVDEAELTGAIVYDQEPYAEIQHRRLDFKHLPGRTALYLEIPMITEINRMRGMIAARIRWGLRR